MTRLVLKVGGAVAAGAARHVLELAAAGSAPYNGSFAQLDPDRLTLVFNGATVVEAGRPLGVEPDPPGEVCKIELELGLGEGAASYLTSDLSYDYVRINADYRS